MDLADRGRGHRVEADQRTRGHDDPAAILSCKLDQVLVLEQRPRAETTAVFPLPTKGATIARSRLPGAHFQ